MSKKRNLYPTDADVWADPRSSARLVGLNIKRKALGSPPLTQTPAAAQAVRSVST
jgi:hypothetical protein